MLVECQNCGAPLKADGSKAFVDCQYCGRTNKVASSKTLMAHVPVDWKPPAQWTPEMRNQVVTGALASNAATGGGLTGCISVAVVVAILGVVAVVVVSTVGTGSGGIPAVLGPSWDGTAPFECSGNEEVRIEGVHATLPGQTAVRARLNCDVTIIDSDITAMRGIDASGNGTTRLENTTLRTSSTGIELSMNKRLILVNSQIIAGGVGIDARQNADVTLEGGRVEGSPVAVQIDRNGELVNHGAALVDRP
jgi:hypothetical protein